MGEDFPESKEDVSVHIESIHQVWSGMDKLTSMQQDTWLWVQVHSIDWKQMDQKLTKVMGCIGREVPTLAHRGIAHSRRQSSGSIAPTGEVGKTYSDGDDLMVLLFPVVMKEGWKYPEVSI